MPSQPNESDMDHFCAPGDELDFRGMESNVQCHPDVITAESFSECRTICEEILNVDDEATMPKKTRSRARGKENCRCLCKILHLNNKCSSKSM